jgi:hypothetical protein
MFEIPRKIFLSFSFVLFFLLLTISLGCDENRGARENKSIQKNGREREIKRNFSLAVWAEFLEYEEYEKIYDRLEKLGIELFLRVKYGDFPHPSLEKMKFRAWLLLEEKDGYWISVWNAAKFFQLVSDFLKNYSVEWIILDFEPPYEFATKLTNVLDFPKVITLITPPDDIYEEGKKKIYEIIEFAHSKKVKVMCVAIPFIVDDILRNSEKIQRNLGIPLPENCDEYSFMVYSTILKSGLENAGIKIDTPEFFVWDYAKDIFKIFGEKSALSLGLVGEDTFGNKGYNSPDELIKDISAGLSAGIKNFNIWVLDNMKDGTGWNLEKWLDISYVEPSTPPRNETIESIRKFIVDVLTSIRRN